MTKKVQISQQQAALSAKLNQLKAQKKLRNNEVAAIFGRSEGTISDLLNGSRSLTPKLISNIEAKLAEYIVAGNLISSLRQYSVMWNLARSCKESSDMRLVVGNTGIGKSVVFRKFAEQHSHVYYLKVDRRYTWNKLLLKMSQTMGIKLAKLKKPGSIYTTNYLYDTIIRHIENTSGSNPLLIIDESEVLSNAIYKNIKNLYTATEGLMGIIIVGITEVKGRIARISGLDTDSWLPVRDDSNQYTTFARRLKVHRIPNIGWSKAEAEGGVHDMDMYCRARGISSPEVISAARRQWWNYEEAERAVKRAHAFGFEMDKMNINEFNAL
ncbi:MAG TPA: ATP-binding protein [Bacteroidales bacterium]|jgi:transcriptional regulator with XRE-family HTH domain|nr:ATP-binding protein [Bacteroidales bacterium]